MCARFVSVARARVVRAPHAFPGGSGVISLLQAVAAGRGVGAVGAVLQAEVGICGRLPNEIVERGGRDGVRCRACLEDKPKKPCYLNDNSQPTKTLLFSFLFSLTRNGCVFPRGFNIILLASAGGTVGRNRIVDARESRVRIVLHLHRNRPAALRARGGLFAKKHEACLRDDAHARLFVEGAGREPQERAAIALRPAAIIAS